MRTSSVKIDQFLSVTCPEVGAGAGLPRPVAVATTAKMMAATTRIASTTAGTQLSQGLLRLAITSVMR
jgi:hypothetical protein